MSSYEASFKRNLIQSLQWMCTILSIECYMAAYVVFTPFFYVQLRVFIRDHAYMFWSYVCICVGLCMYARAEVFW